MAVIRSPIAWGILLTALVLALVVGLAYVKDEAGVAAYARFLALDPNAMGDTLAGIFASLAFIWIVVTVFLQSAELREQREVLKAQRKEFEQMVVAQQAQVDALRAQTSVFLDEQKDRQEKRVKEVFLASFESIKNKILEIVDHREIGIYERHEAHHQFGIGDGQYKERLSKLEGLDAIESIYNLLNQCRNDLRAIQDKGELRFFPGKIHIQSLLEKVKEVQDLEGLSESISILRSDYRLERLSGILEKILSMSSGLPERGE